jgi:hypothetical protein
MLSMERNSRNMDSQTQEAFTAADAPPGFNHYLKPIDRNAYGSQIGWQW